MLSNSKMLYLLLIISLPVCTLAAYDPNHFDPNNAAHWYRKAFELYEEPNDIDLAGYTWGRVELTPKIERFLKAQQPIIEIVTKASQIGRCDWQFDPLIKSSNERMEHFTEAKNISYLLLANARYNEDKGLRENLYNKYNIILQFAAHVDEDSSIGYLVALTIRAASYHAIHQYLNHHLNMPMTDLGEIKKLLQNESSRHTISYKDIIARSIKDNRIMLTDYKQYIYSDVFLVKQIGIPADKLSEDFYSRNLRFYNEYMNKYQSYLDLPYPDACQKITDLGNELKEKTRRYFMEYRDQLGKKIEDYETEILSKIAKNELNPVSLPNLEPKFLSGVDVEYLEKCDLLYTLFSVPDSPSMFSIDTRIRTQLDALKAGISLLIQYRKIKTIPSRLPDDSPKDLFSDKPFWVIKTTDGFKLKCQGEDLSRHQVYEYEFNLPTDSSLFIRH